MKASRHIQKIISLRLKLAELTGNKAEQIHSLTVAVEELEAAVTKRTVDKARSRFSLNAHAIRDIEELEQAIKELS